VERVEAEAEAVGTEVVVERVETEAEAEAEVVEWVETEVEVAEAVETEVVGTEVVVERTETAAGRVGAVEAAGARDSGRTRILWPTRAESMRKDCTRGS